MDALLRRLIRIGLRRGLSGEHWAWLLLAGAAFLFRRTRREEGPATTLELAPGERYLVHLVDSGEGGRRCRSGQRSGGGAGPLGEVFAAALEANGRDGGSAASGSEASAAPPSVPPPAD